MDDRILIEILERAGLAVDEGDRISGPFIPDGTVRIYDPETDSMLASGRTLREAFEDVQLLPDLNIDRE